MKTTKDLEEELKKLLSPNLSMPKIYSFDETKKLVNLAHQKGREELIEKIKNIEFTGDKVRCDAFNYAIDEVLNLISTNETNNK